MPVTAGTFRDPFRRAVGKLEAETRAMTTMDNNAS
jgi:hypothetical protein